MGILTIRAVVSVAIGILVWKLPRLVLLWVLLIGIPSVGLSSASLGRLHRAWSPMGGGKGEGFDKGKGDNFTPDSLDRLEMLAVMKMTIERKDQDDVMLKSEIVRCCVMYHCSF